MYPRFKRWFDILGSVLALVILLPVFLLICAAIKIDSPGNIIFKQKRIGAHKKYFYIYKFRSMRIEAPRDAPTHLLHHAHSYITRVGAFLRKSSLDELPQLVNILKGDMSFVGPRPALWNQYDLIEEREKYRANDIPVGLTGWAQINGRDELPIWEKARLDGEYMQRKGLLFDLKILVLTVVRVFQAEGIVEGKSKNMPKEEKTMEKKL